MMSTRSITTCSPSTLSVTRSWMVNLLTFPKMANMPSQYAMESGWYRKKIICTSPTLHHFATASYDSHFRFKAECWKFALTEEDPQQCPTSHGQVWRYRNKIEGQRNSWLEAGDGLQVICAPSNSSDNLSKTLT